MATDQSENMRFAAIKAATPTPATVKISKPTVTATKAPAVKKAAPAAAPAPAAPSAPADPYANINGIYNPLLANLQAQTQAVNDRYAANSADIKNLFGTLTTLREADKAKIQDQFVNTLAAQQAALAGRTAEVRMNEAAGQAGAQQAAQELGGPATGPVTSLAQQAAERGIAQQNALSTVWQNLQGSQNINNQQSINNQIAGFGGLQVQTSKDLAALQSKELMGLSSQQAQLQSQLAQAKSSYDAAIANNNATAAQKALDNQTKIQVALIRASKAKSSGTGTAKAKTTTVKASNYGTLNPWYTKAKTLGVPESTATGMANAIDELATRVSPTTTTNKLSGTSTTAVSKARILAAYKKQYPGTSTVEAGLVADYLTRNGYK